MEGKDIGKITTIIGLAALGIAGFYKKITNIIEKDIFSRLTSQQTFLIVCGIIAVGFVVVLLLIALVAFKKDNKGSSTSSKNKKVSKRKNRILILSFVTFCILLGVLAIFFINNNNESYDSYILDESFSENSYPEIWRVGNQKEVNVDITNGYLQMTSKSDYGVSRRIDLDKYLDFSLTSENFYEIELGVKMTKISQNIDIDYGLQWGGNSREGKYYGYYITGGMITV